MRAKDWAATPLGPVQDWPQSLRSALGICLGSRFPIAIYWGERLSLLYNDAWSPIPGSKHPWALGRDAREVWPEIWDAIGPLFEQVMANGESTYAEDGLLLMHRHGYTEECYFNFTFTPIRGLEGRVEGVFNAVIETTFRVISERRTRVLRELSEKLLLARSPAQACSAAAESLGAARKDVAFCAVYLLDAGGQRARRSAIAGVEDAEGFPDTITLAGDDLWRLDKARASGEVQVVRGVERLLASAPAGGAWPESAREALVAPIVAGTTAGAAGFLILGASPRRAVDEQYQYFAESAASHLGRSVATTGALEAERKRAEALAELDKAKTVFFSNVSHEFRTPLTLMLGPLDDLLARPDAAERETLSVMQRSGQRLLKLVNTLLDFARIEAGRAQASYQPTDLAAYTAELASNFRSACERAGLRLEVDCPPLAEEAYVDREMWEKIVLNLLSHAFKFTLAGGIRVSLRAVGDHVRLEVQDTGSGIPPEELPRMFERFHRIEGTPGRSHEGSGIGLALVQELVKLHGGSISVASEPAKGSTFTVLIPRGAAHLPVAALGAPRAAAAPLRAGAYVDEALSWLPGKEHPAATSKGGPRIVLADDNADLREYARRLLAEHHEVEAVADGEAALAAARARRPDLVVSDVMMPKLDGFGLIRLLREDPALRTVPVVLLSARAGEEARMEGLEKGADDYLTKPFSARELLVRVGALLQAQQARREAFAQVRDKLEEMETLLRALPVGVFIARDAACRRIDMNPAGAAMLRMTEGENASKTGPVPAALPFRVFQNGTEVAGDALPMQRAARLGRPLIGEEIELRFADGSSSALYEHAVPLFDAGGRVRGCVGVFVDVTERKRAEEALRESEGRFRTLADTAPAMLWITDADAMCTFLSRGWYEFTGQTGDSALGLGWTEAVHPQDRDEAGRIFLAANARREAFALDYRLRRRDGEYRWAIDAGRPRFGAKGEFLGFIGSVIDVHELRQSEARKNAMFETALDGIISIDDRDRVVEFNPAAERIFGYQRADVLGRELADLIVPPRLREQHRQGMARYLSTGEQRVLDRRLEMPAMRADGSEFPAELAVTRIPTGAPPLFTAYLRDITDRKKAEAALKEADRRKDEFLATLSHELRNPLAPLRNALQLMKLTGAGGGEARPLQDMMERQVSHLIRLVDDLLEISRITRGAFELRKERVALAAIVRNAVETSEPLIEAAGHRFSMALPDEPAWVEGDVVRLAQILSNLLNNAARYTPRGGEISVHTALEPGGVAITVRDNGAGIEPAAMARVFEMFSKGQGSSGLGVGLALSRRLAEMHGGTLEGRSDGAGHGAQFTLRLPLAPDQRAPTATEEQRPAPPTPRRVLVVDDNRDAADSLGSLLKFMGADVQVAYDGAQALAEFEKRRPQIVLLDIGMPGMDGYEVARRIRSSSNGADVPLVAVTGWGQESDRRLAREAGFDHHLVKPADLGALQALLSSV